VLCRRYSRIPRSIKKTERTTDKPGSWPVPLYILTSAQKTVFKLGGPENAGVHALLEGSLFHALLNRSAVIRAAFISCSYTLYLPDT
jgi:hypothetical protein